MTNEIIMINIIAILFILIVAIVALWQKIVQTNSMVANMQKDQKSIEPVFNIPQLRQTDDAVQNDIKSIQSKLKDIQTEQFVCRNNELDTRSLVLNNEKTQKTMFKIVVAWLLMLTAIELVQLFY